jgi:transposase
MLWQNKNTNYSRSPVDVNHLLFKVNKYIDLSFTHQLVTSYYNSKHGRPSIDPEIFFRMLLISFFITLTLIENYVRRHITIEFFRNLT